MLSQQDNELLTRTGAGTPMGELFRRFWHPVMLSEELLDPDGPPRRLRVLGEDLVAFRDTNGAVGIIAARCPHRQAPLFYGRNEKGGLRCVYHGWKFDTTGQCVDMPTEPASSNFASRVKVRAYPAEEFGDVVWVYMGPPELKPELPQFEWARVPSSHRLLTRWVQRCNWMQAAEGEIDSAHVSWLHSSLRVEDSPFAGRFNDAVLTDGAPKLTVMSSDYGLVYGARRDMGDGQYYWRVTQFLLPTYSLIPSKGFPRTGHCWIPIDDEHICAWQYTYHTDRPLSEEEVQARKNSPQLEPVKYQLPDGEIIDAFQDVRRRENDYLIDRELQQTANFTGISVIRSQDTAMTEGMGRIVDRTKERLGTTDMAIIAARRQILKLARDLQEGVEPAARRQGDLYNRRALDLVSPESDFLRVLELNAREAVGTA